MSKGYSTAAAILFILLLGAGRLHAQVKPGEKAPDFKLTSVDGKEMSLNSISKRVVMLHFWKAN